MDALILNSTRSPGESQAQSVARRMRNFQGERWESLWLEATRPPDRVRLGGYGRGEGQKGRREGPGPRAGWAGQEGRQAGIGQRVTSWADMRAKLGT